MILLADSKLERLMHSNMCHKVTNMSHLSLRSNPRSLSGHNLGNDQIADLNKAMLILTKRTNSKTYMYELSNVLKQP